MSESLIKSSIFDKRGPIPNTILNQLGIRGSQENVSEACVRLGWGSRDPIVIPILITEPGTGRIIGSRISVRGTIASYEVKASSLWPEAAKDATLSFNLEGKDFTFSNRGANMPGKLKYIVIIME